MTVLQAILGFQKILCEIDDEFERLRAKYAEHVHCNIVVDMTKEIC